jgi:hypothetical protein
MRRLHYRASTTNGRVSDSRAGGQSENEDGARAREREESQWRAPERVVEGGSGLAAGVQAPLLIDGSTSHLNARVAANNKQQRGDRQVGRCTLKHYYALQQIRHYHHHHPSVQLWESLTASRQLTREHGHNGVGPCMLRSCGNSPNTLSGSDPGSPELKTKADAGTRRSCGSSSKTSVSGRMRGQEDGMGDLGDIHYKAELRAASDMQMCAWITRFAELDDLQA